LSIAVYITPKKAKTGPIKLPLPVATQLYWKRKAKNNSTEPVLRKPLPIYIADVKNISSLTQLLEEIAKKQEEIKALTDNQVKVQPKTSESYRIIIKALDKKRTEFHAYKLKEERSYRVVLKNMLHSNPEEIKMEIEKLEHTVTNIWNVKQYRTKQN
jgi:phosphoenolpyruvate carboxylase